DGDHHRQGREGRNRRRARRPPSARLSARAGHPGQNAGDHLSGHRAFGMGPGRSEQSLRRPSQRRPLLTSSYLAKASTGNLSDLPAVVAEITTDPGAFGRTHAQLLCSDGSLLSISAGPSFTANSQRKPSTLVVPTTPRKQMLFTSPTATRVG